MNYQEYINTELLVLIPVLYFVGMGLKKSLLADKYIPMLLGLLGIFLSGIWRLAQGDISGTQSLADALFTVITQGVLAAGGSVYVNQLHNQAKKEE